MARDIPEDMRRTEKVQLRLSPEAAAALRKVPAGYRSEWVSNLILSRIRRLQAGALRKLGYRRGR